MYVDWQRLNPTMPSLLGPRNFFGVVNFGAVPSAVFKAAVMCTLPVCMPGIICFLFLLFFWFCFVAHVHPLRRCPGCATCPVQWTHRRLGLGDASPSRHHLLLPWLVEW